MGKFLEMDQLVIGTIYSFSYGVAGKVSDLIGRIFT
jgi:hypothetical protein